jgi:ferric-dicitrate binding protein FerR (iron transport regulator)
MSGPLQKIVAEARQEFRAETVDWHAVERGLFARIEADRRAARMRATRERGQLWTGAAAALAAAGIVLVLVARPGRERPTAQGDGDRSAATLLAVMGPGEVLVNGAQAPVGVSLHRGDVVEARGAKATLVRPGRVTMVIEAGTRAVVARVEDPLVLTLDRGAVDAQVVPVPSGEAFAVDVDGSRVAVHGTHLRVARDAGRVTVDLSEGVVSVGRAPRAGSVLGALVTAPAHAEFAAADVRGTMTVTHDPSAIREPEAGFGPAASLAPSTGSATNPPAPARLPVASEAHPSVNAAPKTAARATQPVDAVVEPPAAPSSAGLAPATESPSASASIDPDAENTVARAVRACISEHPRPDGVTVVVSTTLHLWLGDDGSVHTARFEPPVAPDINACAAAAIYRARFPKSGAVKIPVDFSN